MYRRKADRMVSAYSKRKRHNVEHFGVGDFVSVRLPRIDRVSTDVRRMSCLVMEYSSVTSELEVKWSYLKGWEKEPRISLCEATIMSNPKNRNSCRSNVRKRNQLFWWVVLFQLIINLDDCM